MYKRQDDLFEGGLTLADQIEFAKLCPGKVDILQIRGGSIDPSQPTYLDLREIPQDVYKRQVPGYLSHRTSHSLGSSTFLQTGPPWSPPPR